MSGSLPNVTHLPCFGSVRVRSGDADVSSAPTRRTSPLWNYVASRCSFNLTDVETVGGDFERTLWSLAPRVSHKRRRTWSQLEEEEEEEEQSGTGSFHCHHTRAARKL